MFFICVEQPCMMSLPNEEAKIEQLIRQLATISPPFVNSREELKQLAAAIYLLADQLTAEPEAEASEETIIDLPPLNIPVSRPIFADHSNPVPAVSEESIEEELQWQPAPTPPQPVQETPLAPPTTVETPAAEYRQPEPGWQPTPPAPPEPVAIAPESKPVQESADLFAQPDTTPVTETIPVEEEKPDTDQAPVEPPARLIVPPAAEPEPEIQPEPPVITPTPVVEVTPEPLPPPVAPPPVVTAERDLQRALPLVRRLEFINRLFNGNDGEWQLFCQAVNRSAATSDALQIYRESYIRYGWERHAEMADLLKQLIVKTFG